MFNQNWVIHKYTNVPLLAISDQLEQFQNVGLPLVGNSISLQYKTIFNIIY